MVVNTIVSTYIVVKNQLFHWFLVHSFKEGGQFLKRISRMGLWRSSNLGLRYLPADPRDPKISEYPAQVPLLVPSSSIPEITHQWKKAALSCLCLLQSNGICSADSSCRSHFLVVDFSDPAQIFQVSSQTVLRFNFIH